MTSEHCGAPRGTQQNISNDSINVTAEISLEKADVSSRRMSDASDGSDDLLPFALPSSSYDPINGEDPLGLSLAATTISGGSVETLQSPASPQVHVSPRTPLHDGPDGRSSASADTPNPQLPRLDVAALPDLSQDRILQMASNPLSDIPRLESDDSFDTTLSPAAAAAGAAAAAIIQSGSVSDSFSLRHPELLLPDETVTPPIARPVLQRRDSHKSFPQPMDKDLIQSAASTPLFTQLSGDDQTLSSEAASTHMSIGSLGFSELMHEASDQSMDFTMVRAQLQPVPEEGSTPEDNLSVEKAGSESDFLLGGTIIPPASSPMIDQSRAIPSSSILGPRGGRGRPGAVRAAQLDSNSFSVSTHLPSPISAQDVVDVLANPHLLRLWCNPVRDILVTTEGGMTPSGSGDGGDKRRLYDGEWVEITTPQLTSPTTCSSYAHGAASVAMSMVGFPSTGVVRMFVERSRGQVGISMGPFVGNMMAEHTFSIQDIAVERASSDVGPGATSGVSITNTVRMTREDHADGGGSYSCGLFSMLQQWFLPGMAGYMDQAILSLEKLSDVVCDGGENGLLCNVTSCGTTFSDPGMTESQGRTPLLARP